MTRITSKALSKPLYDKDLNRLPEDDAALIRALRQMPESERTHLIGLVLNKAATDGIVF